MLEKIKNWNWRVIGSVVSAFLWALVTCLLMLSLNAPEFESVKASADVSHDTIYGFAVALTATSFICFILQMWKMFDCILALPCFAKKRKK